APRRREATSDFVTPRDCIRLTRRLYFCALQTNLFFDAFERLALPGRFLPIDFPKPRRLARLFFCLVRGRQALWSAHRPAMTRRKAERHRVQPGEGAQAASSQYRPRLSSTWIA